MGDVVILGAETSLSIPIERVLDGGKDAEYVLLLSCTKDGRFVAATSDADLSRAADACQRFLHKLYRGDYDDLMPSRYFILKEKQSCPSGDVIPIRSSNSASQAPMPPPTPESGSFDSKEKR